MGRPRELWQNYLQHSLQCFQAHSRPRGHSNQCLRSHLEPQRSVAQYQELRGGFHIQFRQSDRRCIHQPGLRPLYPNRPIWRQYRFGRGTEPHEDAGGTASWEDQCWKWKRRRHIQGTCPCRKGAPDGKRTVRYDTS